MKTTTVAPKRRACLHVSVGLSLLFAHALGVCSAVTATQFAVTDGGAATLSIPIQVPRGTGGMEPQLALAYSSTSGNGMLGYGWSLTGPSAITRCPKVKSNSADRERGFVSFGPSDRFCLDGQRLMLVERGQENALEPPSQDRYGKADTEYRTERESFSRIRARGWHPQSFAPLGFIVETKAGLILEFGSVGSEPLQSVSSVILAKFPSWPGPSLVPTEVISRWMLRKISDRTGNSMLFEYCAGEVLPNGGAPFEASQPSNCDRASWNGSAPIQYIRYTNRGAEANGSFAVVFRYEARPDAVTGYFRGASSKQTQRLSAIQTYRNFTGLGRGQLGELVRSYDIYYEPLEASPYQSLRATNTSRILELHERVNDPSTTPLPRVRFAMASDLVFRQTTQHRAAIETPEPPDCQPKGEVMRGRDSLGRGQIQCP